MSEAEATAQVTDVNEQAEQEKPKGRQDHPLVGTDDRDVYPFRETPGDYDFDAHHGLKKRDFATEIGYRQYQVERREFDLERAKEELEAAKSKGSATVEADKKRYKAMQDKMAELQAQLEAQGIDVDSVLDEEEDSDD